LAVIDGCHVLVVRVLVPVAVQMLYDAVSETWLVVAEPEACQCTGTGAVSPGRRSTPFVACIELAREQVVVIAPSQDALTW